MDIDNYDRQKRAFFLREKLLEIEKARRDGVPDYSCDEVVDMMRQTVKIGDKNWR